MTPAKIKILMAIATYKHPEFPHIDINPTVREIAKLVGSSSTTVHEHMIILVKAGYLKKAKQINSKRVYVLTNSAKGLLFDTVRHDNDRIATTISEQFTAIINKYGRHFLSCGIAGEDCKCTCGLNEAIKEFV